jgi:hypothetical protein
VCVVCEACAECAVRRACGWVRGGDAGVPYFECPNGYGSLLRPNLVKVGDYPEVDEFASDPDEI